MLLGLLSFALFSRGIWESFALGKSGESCQMSVREVNMHGSEYAWSEKQHRMALEPSVLYQMVLRREAEIIHAFNARVPHGRIRQALCCF